MIPKKDPASLASERGFQTTFSNFYYIRCDHERATLVRIDCGAGGVQFRKFCTSCWAPIGTAFPHAIAKAEEQRSGIQTPLADLEAIHAAQDCARRAIAGRP